MELFSRFKRDYLNYLFSIIIPVIINAVSIPLFKQLLGSGGYGDFTITFNSILLLTAALTGWLTQSIIRFFPSSDNKRTFAKVSLLLIARLQLLIALPCILTVVYLKNDWILGLLYFFTLFITSMQFTILALSQSAFLSVKSIYSEIIRSVSYISTALLFLYFFPQHYLYSLLGAVFISYFLSFVYLFRQTFNNLVQASINPVLTMPRHYLRKFLSYGAPLSLWFICAYLISYMDKLFLFRFSGSSIQGDYQAVFDLLSKSITALISPVIFSLFPLLTSAWQSGNRVSAQKLIQRILRIEAAAFVLALAMYFLFGAEWLFRITRVENNLQNLLSGALIIGGTFLWQMAMVVHKKYELSMNTRFLLLMVSFSALAQFILYLFAGNIHPLVYPAGFLLASGMYLFLVSFGFKTAGKKLII